MVIRRVSSGLLLLAFSLGLGPATAGADFISLFGDERVGTSAGQFLRVPVGARPIAMGGGVAAAVTGPGSIWWNPSGMSRQRERYAVAVNHTEYAADIDLDHFSFVRRGGTWQLGFGLGVLRSGEIQRTTEFHPNGTGQTFEANQFVGALSIGRQLTDRFALATTVKLLQENLDDYENRGVFLDLGATYTVGYHNTRLGFAVRNFGRDMRLNGEPPATSTSSRSWQSFPAPTVAVFGFATDFGNPRGRRLTVSLDFSHPSDAVESIILGNELAVGGGLMLRGGYESGVDRGGFSGGFGLEFLRKTLPVSLDYGVVDRGDFGVMHTISLELRR